jgi:hypothetical protein
MHFTPAKPNPPNNLAGFDDSSTDVEISAAFVITSATIWASYAWPSHCSGSNLAK